LAAPFFIFNQPQLQAQTHKLGQAGGETQNATCKNYGALSVQDGGLSYKEAALWWRFVPSPITTQLGT
jgi:hypothetical protein